MTVKAGARFFFQKAERNSGHSAAAEAPLNFHRRLPAYVPTPLIDAPVLARLLGIRQVLVKDESGRFGLPAFKILGASWAVYRALESRVSGTFEPWRTLDELAPKLTPLRPLTLATATDGNHGRAVAHVAALFGLGARIFVPAGTARSRIDAIASEGAQVEVVDGTYEDAVERAARESGDRCLVISDTSWPGYEAIPHWVMEGYSTIFREIDAELTWRGEEMPDLFPVPFGVGSLAAAVVRHYPAGVPKIVAIEPLRAACALASMEVGEIVTIPGPHDSIMAGLNCGRVSLIAWPIISRGIDAFLAISDERAREAMRALARIGIVAGETGAAGLAGLIELLNGDSTNRAALDLNEKTRALILVTEGATDPESYQRIVGLQTLKP
ncbi:MAG TPA: diaminopropionate ammonia-lyase [Chthoniobacterales bacterium]|nr:diaminopropionate ammonia-lyase [Chthoniobacterales bacterium]